MYCDQCGTQTSPSAKFCHSCGHHLVVPEHSSDKPEEPQEATVVIPPPALETSPPHVLASTIDVDAKPAGAHIEGLESEPIQQTITTFHPWRRLFARSVDMTLTAPFLYLLLFYPIGEYPLIEYLFGTYRASSLLDHPYLIGVILTVLFAPIEAAFLSIVGTTPGKSAFGLQLLSSEGTHISYSQACKRAAGVLLYGLGFGIPLVSALTAIYSYRILKAEGKTHWDKNEAWFLHSHQWTSARKIFCAFAVLLTLMSTAITPVVIAKLNSNYWAGRLSAPPETSSYQAPKQTPVLPAAKTETPSEPTDMVSQRELAFKYLNGLYGFPEDQKLALHWYRKAADQGDAEAQRELGTLYENGGGGLHKDKKQAAYWYRKAADQGDAEAQFDLGEMYEDGSGGLPRDNKQAANWYKRAAEQGYSLAQNNLGTMYENGRVGLPRDKKQAAYWYRKAADQHNRSAQNNLGTMYENGSGGLPRDDTQAVFWYKKAASRGHPGAQNNLGRMYFYGSGGLPRDETQAMYWLRKAADKGDPTAQRNLAKFDGRR